MTGERTPPYGYVLVLRGLAKAAIELAARPASLRETVSRVRRGRWRQFGWQVPPDSRQWPKARQ